jgi:hypothetical protein
MAFSDYLTLPNLILLIISICALVWLIFMIRYNYMINEITSWPKINATIAKASTGTGKNAYIDYRLIAFGKSKLDKYYPKITYKYTIDGNNYQSTNVVYGNTYYYNTTDIKALMTKLTPGTVIPIFYNPNNPKEAYIFPGKKSYLEIIISLIILCAVVIMGCGYNSKHKLDNISLTTISSEISKKNIASKKNIETIAGTIKINPVKKFFSIY